MSVNIKTEKGVMTASLQGDIDHHTARELRESIDTAIHEQHPKTLYLDFGGVDFMDSSGIGLIMGRYKQMQLISGIVRVTNTPSYIRRVIRLSGLDKLGVLEREKEVKKEDESHE